MANHYTVERYPNAPEGVEAYRVVGPGVGGWRGIIPRSHDGMPRHVAEELADLLNTAHRMGQHSKMAQLKAAMEVIL